MSNRLIRINELIQREISAYLRKRWAKEAATITISGAEIAADLKTCKVYVSILGTDEEAQARHTWLTRHAGELRREVGRHIVMKWTPELEILLDASPHRAGRVLQIIDELDQQERNKPKTDTEA
jgi:ribosome-binding factor A